MPETRQTAILLAAFLTLTAATARPQTPYAEDWEARARTALAERDSASAAWAIAEHRIAVLEAQAARQAVQDSLNLEMVNSWWRDRLADRNRAIRDMALISAGTAITCILIVYATRE